MSFTTLIGPGTNLQIETDELSKDSISYLVQSRYFIPYGVEVIPADEEAEGTVIRREEKTGEDGGTVVTITSVEYAGDESKGVLMRALPDIQPGSVVYIEPQEIKPNIRDEQFSTDGRTDEWWSSESVDPENYGESLISDGDLNVLWGDVPYAFKRGFPHEDPLNVAPFGTLDSNGTLNYAKNLSLYVGAMGTISQEMAEPFAADGPRPDAHVPDVVYFGIHIVGLSPSQNLYIILAHTELPTTFSSGDVLSGPTKNFKMILAPETAALIDIGEHDEFLGGGVKGVYMVGPSGIGEDGDFDPTVFANTPPAVMPQVYLAMESIYGYIFSYNKSDFSGGSWDEIGDGTVDFDFIALHDGFLYIAEQGTKIAKYSTGYEYIATFEISGVWICGIDVDDSGIYISDGSGHKVVKLSKDTGAVLAEWGGFTFDYESETGMQDPRGIAVGGGYVYVADSTLYRVVQLTTSLSFVQQIGNYNVPEENYFNKPLRVAANSSNLFVLDTNGILFKFSGASKVVEYDASYDSPVDPIDPKALAADDSNLYVSSNGTSAVYKRSLETLGPVSDSLSQENPYNFNDIAVQQ